MWLLTAESGAGRQKTAATDSADELTARLQGIEMLQRMTARLFRSVQEIFGVGNLYSAMCIRP